VIVSTPGINWYEIEADGFRTGNADDLASDETVREYLDMAGYAGTSYEGCKE
jgi:hypothetical protein